MKTAFLTLTLAILTACSTTQIYRNPSANGLSGNVQVLYGNPAQPFESLGLVSAKRYKPGWSDPTVADAIPQLQAAAQQLGADAIIVRQSQDGGGSRFIRVEAEAIKFQK